MRATSRLLSALSCIATVKVHPLFASNALAHCLEEVKRYAYPRYVSVLLAPDSQRAALATIYAFDIEIGKVAAATSQPMAAMIRLQWWQDALAKLSEGEVLAHPVVEALDGLQREGRLDHAALRSAIEARASEMNELAPATMEATEVYLRGAYGQILTAALRAAAVDPAQAGMALDHAALAYGWTQLLGAVPTLVGSENKLPLPSGALHGHGLEPDDVYSGVDQEGLRAACRVWAGRAREHIAEARAVRRNVAKSAQPILRHATLAAAALQRLSRAGYNPHDPRLRERDTLLPFRLLLRKTLTGY